MDAGSERYYDSYYQIFFLLLTAASDAVRHVWSCAAKII
jgi:hypothetical protein